MAGIGLKLRQLKDKGSVGGLVGAYLFSLVVATGPVLMTTTGLALVFGFIRHRLPEADGWAFTGLVAYCYAFSLLAGSPFFFVVTRYLADRHFLHRAHETASIYWGTLAVLFSLQSAMAFWFLPRLGLPFGIGWSVFILFLAVGGIWTALIFLSAARHYLWVVAAFGAGAVLGVFLPLVWVDGRGLEGCVKGFTAGQCLIFMLLSAGVTAEFGHARKPDFGFLAHLRRYPALALTGFFYYLGLWVDKFMFWASTEGERAATGLRMSSVYDVPVFLASLTTIPSVTFFLLHMETSFFLRYRDYYRSVRERGSLDSIRKQREALVDDLSHHLRLFLVIQGVASGFCLIFVKEVAALFLLSPLQTIILRVAVAGAFLQTGMVIILNIFFYFSFYKEALGLTLAYCLLNALFTGLTLRGGDRLLRPRLRLGLFGRRRVRLFRSERAPEPVELLDLHEAAGRGVTI